MAAVDERPRCGTAEEARAWLQQRHPDWFGTEHSLRSPRWISATKYYCGVPRWISFGMVGPLGSVVSLAVTGHLDSVMCIDLLALEAAIGTKLNENDTSGHTYGKIVLHGIVPSRLPDPVDGFAKDGIAVGLWQEVITNTRECALASSRVHSAPE